MKLDPEVQMAAESYGTILYFHEKAQNYSVK